MRRFNSLLCHLILLIFTAASLTGCNLSFFNFMNFMMAGNGGNSAASGDIELSQTEADLYSDGPLDMPVTIAKLDAPDLSKVSVDVEPVGSPDVGAPFAANDTLYRMTITGAPGAIGSVDATPYVVSFLITDFDVDTSSRVIVDVEADGSFVLEAIMTLDQQIMFAAMAPDQETTSPFTIIAADQEVYFDEATGTFVFILTNTNYLNTNQAVFSDPSGYAYMSLSKPDGSKAFLRRNVRATDIQIIEENVTESVDHIFAMSENKIATIYDTGELTLTLPTTEPVTALVKAPLFEVLTTYEVLLDTLDPYESELSALSMTENERALIVTRKEDGASVKYYRTTSDYKINLIPLDTYDVAWTSLADSAEQIFIMTGDGTSFTLQSLDLSGSLGRAWTERTLIEDGLTYDAVTTLQATSDGEFLILATEESGTPNIYTWSPSDGLNLFRDGSASGDIIVNPKINSSGTLIVACKLGSAGTGNQLVYHRVNQDASGEFLRLTANPLYDHCSEATTSFALDGSGFLHFYRGKVNGASPPQHAIISIRRFE